MTRPFIVATVLTVLTVKVGLSAALFAGAWFLWQSIPRDLRTMRDFDRARTGLGRAHQRLNGGAR